MDISTLRLGLAHSALRQALGDEMSPLSFAQGSFAFLDRRSGAQFFCSAESNALPIMSILPGGKLGDTSDEQCKAIRTVAEPIYLAAWSSFARDFDRASSTEARHRAEASASETSALAKTISAPAQAQPGQAHKANTEKTRPDATKIPAKTSEPIAGLVAALEPASTTIAVRQPAPMAAPLPASQPRSISEPTSTTVRRVLRPIIANPSADRV